MARLLLELTNRCNLRCLHCYEERHAGSGHLSRSIIERVVTEGHDCGVDEVVFTGGEPTLHPDFKSIVPRVALAGYDFGFVSNGITFPAIHPIVLEHRERFRGVTFSLDGPDAESHDALRGQGSFRSVLKAATVCVVRDLPFSINTVVTTSNRHQLGAMVELAAGLGSTGLRFGHLLTGPDSPRPALALDIREMREVENEIAALAADASLPVVMAPGYYCETDLFPCAPLRFEEYNVDYRGRLTLCCHLSGIFGSTPGRDLVADLHHFSLAQIRVLFRHRVDALIDQKRAAAAHGHLEEDDYFACRYCVRHLGASRAGAIPVAITGHRTPTCPH